MGTRRAAWLITVGGANPLRLVSTCAPTACPERFTSSIDALTISRRRLASSSPTGSGAIIAATRLPSAPRSVSARTLTGTIARSTGSLSSTPRRARWRPSAPATIASTTSFTVPPSSFFTAFTSPRDVLTHVKRRCGPICPL